MQKIGPQAQRGDLVLVEGTLDSKRRALGALGIYRVKLPGHQTPIAMYENYIYDFTGYSHFQAHRTNVTSSSDLGENIRSARLSLNLSQRDVASGLSINQGTLAKWETGDRSPSAEMISALAAYLLTDANSLLRVRVT